MARSITYWYDIIIAEKNTMSNLNSLQPNVDSSQALLSDVTTTSKIARWRLWVWCVAVSAYAVDVLFDLQKIELEAISLRSRFGTLPWYVWTAKNFQYGDPLPDPLVWENNQYVYSPIVPEHRIIKMAAAIEAGNTVNLKVAKLVGTVTTKLDITEKTAFVSYMTDATKVKPAGVVVNVISDDPDDLRLYVTIKYDPLVMMATGELLALPGVFPVNDKINKFIADMPFNGVLELCNLVDVIQSATGVVSVYITDAQARYGANPFVSFPERYLANAGYLIIDVGTPLNTSITYE